MLKGKTYESCYLSNLGINYHIDLPASAIPESAIQKYVCEEVVPCTPHKDMFSSIFGGVCDHHTTRYCVEHVVLPNGKIAFPVYVVTPWYEDDEPWKSREGEMELVGWSIQDEDPFAKFNRV